MTQTAMQQNYHLKDEIKAYWSARAETFDSQPGHEIFSEAERAAWHALIKKHLGMGQVGPEERRKVLDLASGTGVVSHLLDDLGFSVTGMDWAEPMLERARAKAKTRGRSIRFLIGDAESTMEPDATYDAITNRHLVWTLVDPLGAFREWRRVLKPGGRVLIVDGDFVNPSPLAKITSLIAKLVARLGLAKPTAHHGPTSADLAGLFFARGAGRSRGGSPETGRLLQHHRRHRPQRH